MPYAHRLSDPLTPSDDLGKRAAVQLMAGRLNLPADFTSFVQTLSDGDIIVAEVQEYLDKLKEYRNSFLPISRLPEDVLLEVFARLIRSYDVSEYYHWKQQQPYAWIPAVTHICRRWRRIAIGCAQMWSWISLTGNQNLVSAFLHRSKECPLAFGASADQYYYHSNLDFIFGRDAGRVRAAHSVTIDFETARVLQAISTDGPLQLPCLEELGLRASPPDDVGPIPALPDAFMPRLKFLSFMPAFEATSLTQFIRPTLTRLHYIEEHYPRPTFGVGEWLDMLSMLPGLQELHLESLMAPFVCKFSQHSPPRRRILLPELKELWFLDQRCMGMACASGYARILEHISCPPDIRLELTGGFAYVDRWQDEAEYTISCVYGAISPQASHGTTLVSYVQALASVELNFGSWSGGTLHLRPIERSSERAPDVNLLLHASRATMLPADWLSLLTAAQPLCFRGSPGFLHISYDTDIWPALCQTAYLGAHTLFLERFSCLEGFVASLEGIIASDAQDALATIRRIWVTAGCAIDPNDSATRTRTSRKWQDPELRRSGPVRVRVRS